MQGSSSKRQKTTGRLEGGATKKKARARASRASFNHRVVVPSPVVDSGTSKQCNSDERLTRFNFLDTHYCDCEALPVGDHPQKHCNVLDYFGLYYSSALNVIICYEHGCAVPLDRWSAHLLYIDNYGKKAHQCGNPNARKKRELDAMKAHVEASFRPANSDGAIILPDGLQDILPMAVLYDGERPPILKRYPCPVPGCGIWRAVSTNKTSHKEHDLGKHLKEDHCSSLSNYPQRNKSPVWSQMLRLVANKYHVFPLPLEWEPPTKSDTPSYPLHLPTTIQLLDQTQQQPASLPPQASWMHDLGWESYRASMLWTECSIMRALEFPSVSMALARGSLKWLEIGLGIIDDILPNYILNANIFLDECHPDIRKAINLGCVLNFFLCVLLSTNEYFRSKSGAFRSLTQGGYKKYGRVLSQVVAMMLRMLHEKIVLQEQQPATLCCTETQLKAAVGLYRTIMEGMGDPQEIKLLPSLHAFLDSLLRSGELPMESMSFPTDLLLFFLSIRPDGTYSMATVITSNCAALRYGLLSIYTHVCRCTQAGLKGFTWFEKSKPSSESSSSGDEDKSSGYKEEGEDTSGTEHLESSEMEEYTEENIEDVLESIMNGT